MASQNIEQNSIKFNSEVIQYSNYKQDYNLHVFKQIVI